MDELSLGLIDLNIRLERLTQNVSPDGSKEMLTLADKIVFTLARVKEASPSVLTAELGIIKSNLAPIMRTLINQGLVAVKPDPKDGRVIKYSLTGKGGVAAKARVMKLSQSIIMKEKKQKQVLKLVTTLNELL